MNDGFRRFLTLLLVFVLAFLTVFVIRKMNNGHSLMDILTGKDPNESLQGEKFTLRDKPAINLKDVQVLSAINNESAALVRAVVPSVVSIDTSSVRGNPIRDRWGRTWLQPQKVQGQGSGVIVTNEGHVLTNEHVIRGSQRIRLTLHDGSVRSAKVVGADRAVDIAVLKIDGKGPFTPLKFGDSSKIEVGNIVFAIGSPFGLGTSVTDGKISAKNRPFTDSHVDLLQTSAAINPGNSGGPLINIRGEIIGINSRIYSTNRESPAFQGIGFAIPANDALKTMKDILSRGRPIRGFLGMSMEDMNSFARREFGYEEEAGVRVIQTVKGSPAEKAGLRPNDIIIRFKGEKVSSMRRLIALIQQSEVGSEATLEIWREGAKHTLTATIGEAGDYDLRLTEAPATKQPNKPNRLDPETVMKTIGIDVRNPTAIEKANGIDGVIVNRVLPQSKIRGKILVGDIIRAINGKKVTSRRDFHTRLVASASVQNTDLYIRRGQSHIRITLSPVKLTK